MPTFDELYKYHSFSKAPAAAGLTTGQSVNKAGHTVAAKDVWAFDVPYMFKVNNLSDLNSKSPKLNDLAYVGAVKKYCQFDGTSWVDITSSIESEVLKNADGKDVLKFHKGILEPLDNDNNAGVTSNGQAYRFFVDGKPVQRWVASTDCIDETGFPSLGYNVIVIKNDTDTLLDGTDFFADYYGGTIFFASGQNASTEFEISCFEYVGKYVSEELGGNLVDNRGLDTTENDLWGRKVVKTTDFTRIGHDWLSATALPENWKEGVVKVINNKTYNSDKSVVTNIETDCIKDGTGLFKDSGLTYFNGSLDNLVKGNEMFTNSPVTSFNIDLPKLQEGEKMFKGTSLTDLVNMALPSLLYGNEMFANTSNLLALTTSTPMLFEGKNMFTNSSIYSISSVFPYLYNGRDMFANSNISTINCTFPALIDGLGMFENTSLSLSSMYNLAHSIPFINEVSYDDNGNEYYVWEQGGYFTFITPTWNNSTNDIKHINRKVEVKAEGAGIIVITWKDFSGLSDTDKLVIYREFFKLMNLKGWTILTNLYCNSLEEQTAPEGIYVKTVEASEEYATHTDGSGNYIKLYNAPVLLSPTNGFTTEWPHYDSLEAAETALNLTRLN